MRPGAYAVEVSDDIEAFVERWALLTDAHSLPFHAPSWLRAWYASLGHAAGRHPVLVTVRQAAGGDEVLLLPLVAQRRGGLSVLEFADATVVDYVSPLVARDWAQGRPPAQAARQVWAAMRRALRRHDVLRIEKMLARALEESGSLQNPLAIALRTADCAMSGNQMDIAGPYDAWRHSLDKRVRKELERSWRVFTRSPEARFERVLDPARAVPVFEALETQQAQRMREAGHGYLLDGPPYRRFYRDALLAGLADGSVVLTCLRDRGQVVAALYGARNDSRFIALRLSTGDPSWAHCSPGRLLLERTAHHLHGAGIRWFDLGIGDYRYKTGFKVSGIPLLDATVALSWRGLPLAWAWHGRRILRRQAWLVSWVRRVRRTRQASMESA